MFSLLSQEELLSHAGKLKPTVTVVRDAVTVEGQLSRIMPKNKSKIMEEPKPVAFPIMTPEEQKEFTISYSDACDGSESCNNNKSDNKKNNQRLLDILDEHGVAIVTGILDPVQQVQMEEAFLSDLLSIFDELSSSPSLPFQPMHPSNNDDFKVNSTTMVLPKAMEGAYGFLPARGMPHGKFAWQCRLNHKVQTVFRTLFASEIVEDDNNDVSSSGALVTGLDNPFYTPRQAQSATENSEWLHVDQNKNMGNWKRCFQGILYVWGSDSHECSTTVVWPKSHRLHYDEMMADTNARMWSSQYTALENLRMVDQILPQAVEESRRLAVPAGSLLLWDSRTVHQGWRSGARLAMPVCWEPRSRRDDHALSRKLWMTAVALPSNHSAAEGRVHTYMARRTRPTSTGSSTGGGLRPTLIPWCVRPELVKEWQDMVESSSLLWQEHKNAQESAEAMDSSVQEVVKRLLKEEVASVL